MHFVDVRLRASTDCFEALKELYIESLGFGPVASPDDVLSLSLGETMLRFEVGPPDQRPFYHFAVLIPGDRFEAAHSWLEERVDLLADLETQEKIFHFEDWDALACYFLDPCGNIVEIIAHLGFLESGDRGRFAASEVIGLSELGMVTDDKASAAEALEREAGVHVFDGEVEESGRLTFLGERARVLILAPSRRNWLPTRRASELHPMDVTVMTDRDAFIELPGAQIIRCITSD